MFLHSTLKAQHTQLRLCDISIFAHLMENIHFYLIIKVHAHPTPEKQRKLLNFKIKFSVELSEPFPHVTVRVARP